MFFRSRIDVCALLIRHVAVRDSAEFGADKVGRYHFSNENQLLRDSISIGAYALTMSVPSYDKSAGLTHACQRHQIVVDLPI